METLPLTGERTVPDVPEENYWFRRHEAAYVLLRDYCVDAVVLEAGCGEGYGADLLADVARRVVALDYEPVTTAHVRARYPRLDVLRGNLAMLPLASRSVDVIANLQVIEHLWDQVGFLSECARVLRPGGTLLLTTPNRITFSPGQDRPINPYHTRELNPDELRELLTEAGFAVEFLGGLHHGSRLRELDAAYGGSLIQAQLDVVMGHLPGEAAWPQRLLDDVDSLRANDFVVHDHDVEASLDLVAVARRPA
ncbi:MAG TPA: class I SAM-dependent methyltransferase [Pseudonocardiaceae bacterium]|jgi:SAM-dependent methyltransferase|nr:class I SAM-dependent methyltransferase [Pseudonocardiaceae bacterium]